MCHLQKKHDTDKEYFFHASHVAAKLAEVSAVQASQAQTMAEKKMFEKRAELAYVFPEDFPTVARTRQDQGIRACRSTKQALQYGWSRKQIETATNMQTHCGEKYDTISFLNNRAATMLNDRRLSEIVLQTFVLMVTEEISLMQDDDKLSEFIPLYAQLPTIFIELNVSRSLDMVNDRLERVRGILKQINRKSLESGIFERY